jgi:hypothetical protein
MRRLRESNKNLGAVAPGRVDRDRRIIRGVKILGQSSRNGRYYTTECLLAARRLYEGVKVRVNHKKRRERDEDRPAEDTFGELRNVRVGSDGLYGDLRYLKSHPMAPRVCEAAEAMPSAFGLSHDVSEWASHIDAEGVEVITAINCVESVDLVADPGTTGGLFESDRRRGKSMKTKTKKQPRKKLSDWLTEAKEPAREAVKKLLESGYMSGDIMAEGDSPEAAVGSAFRTAILAVVDDTTADKASKLQKIGAIFDSQEQLVASGAITMGTTEEADDEEVDLDESDEEDPDGSGTDVDGKSKKVEESLRRENARLKRRDECRTLCESMKVQPTPTLLKALEVLDTEADRKALLRESGSRTAPSSGGNRDEVTDGASLAKKILRR